MGRLLERRFLSAAILAGVSLLIVCPAIGAQAADRPASIVVAVVPGTDADPTYQAVLRDALIVKLARNGMRATSAGTPSEARAAAMQQNADYLLLGTWQNTTQTVELSIAMWLPQGTAPLATGKASSRIGLAMDTVAGEALAQVLPAMQARFPAETSTAAGGAASGVTSTAASQSIQPTGGNAGAATGTVTAIGPPEAGEPDAPGPVSRWRRVELAFGGAPLVNTGTVADYAKIGAVASLDFNLRFPVGRSVLAPGLSIEGGWFRAAGIGVADVLVIPAGPDLLWTIAADANPGVSLRLAAGPAAIVAITSWANTVWKVSPFVSGGLDVDVRLTPALGLRIAAEYTVVFEGTMVLQGFTPRLSLRTRF